MIDNTLGQPAPNSWDLVLKRAHLNLLNNIDLEYLANSTFTYVILIHYNGLAFPIRLEYKNDEEHNLLLERNLIAIKKMYANGNLFLLAQAYMSHLQMDCDEFAAEIYTVDSANGSIALDFLDYINLCSDELIERLANAPMLGNNWSDYELFVADKISFDIYLSSEFANLAQVRQEAINRRSYRN